MTESNQEKSMVQKGLDGLEKLKEIKEAAPVLIGISVFLTAIMVFLYSIQIKFTPEIDFKNIYWVFSLVLAMTVVELVLLLYPALATLWIVKAMSQRTGAAKQLKGYLNRREWSFFSFFLFILAFALLCFLIIQQNYSLATLLFLYFAVGFCLVVMFGTENKSGVNGSEPVPLLKWVIAVGLIILPFIWGGTEVLLNTVFRLINIREKNVTVILSAENYQYIHAGVPNEVLKKHEVAQISGAANSDADSNDTDAKNKIYVLKQVDLFWHGVGSKSLISIAATTEKNSQNTQRWNIPLEASGVTVVREDGTND